MKSNKQSDLISYRIQRSEQTLSEVDILIRNELWNTAINRLYYACYYAAIALLLKYNVKATTHTGVRQMLGQHFIKTGKISKELGKIFTDLFDKRHSSDYDDFLEITREDVIELQPAAKAFVIRIKELILS